MGSFSRFKIFGIWLAVFAGLILSILSALKVCTGPCSEAAVYTIFGVDFGWFGMGFFAILVFLLVVRRYFAAAGTIVLFFTLAAVGAELHLIWLQKFVIGRWCPVCLWIALAVFVAAVLLAREKKITRYFYGDIMKTRLTRVFLGLLAVTSGFAVAVMGVTKEAAGESLDIYLGNTRSDTTVYYISDWFCPSCRKIEPEIKRMFPEVAKNARVAFIDLPIHKETVNFTPYHLQFLLYEKPKYISLRHALDELSRKTKSPEPEQVQAAVAPLGVTVRQLNFMEFMNGAKLFESIYKGFGVTATPTVVVENQKTKKRKKLVGDRQISTQAVLSTIKELEK
ncbi:thioredoxin domain-containing protein [Geobacter sp. DSM 9736]|uniref:thioredoxin domain-containing protein n=1 Tax=Geobacter sp. DSM 9736 TaxID=1277350 RepID=UPI000B50FD99|nr:thioredoxin domain-containing protein [Geobacter sp. DSM 9736]SNB45409.1 Thioredoxin [Geobacter sp. DSM 9736]